MAKYKIYHILYLTILLLEASRLCVYQYDNESYPNYCSEDIEFCDDKRHFKMNNITKLCPLFGYQNLDDIHTCELYRNKTHQYSFSCFYKCNQTHYPNFCVGKGVVCPLTYQNCPMFYVPQLYDNITQCNSKLNGISQIGNDETYKHLVAGFEIDKQSLSNIANDEVVMMTFYNNYTIYQCQVNLVSTTTNYYCNVSTLTVTECDPDRMNHDILPYAIQLDFSQIKQDIKIQTLFMNGYTFNTIIEYFCSGNNNGEVGNCSNDTIVINQSQPSVEVTFDIDHNFGNTVMYENTPTWILNNSCVEVSPITFGFTTSQKWNSGSEDKTIVTLIWNNLIHECIIWPTLTNELYLCHTSNLYLTETCKTSISQNETTPAIQISKEGTDMLGIENVVIKMIKRNILYEIEYFCLNTLNNNNTLIIGDVNNMVCSSNAGYDVMFFDTQYLSYLWINLNPAKISLEANVDVIDEPNVSCSPFTDMYILVNKSKSWEDAENYCHEKYNSSLVTITDEEQFKSAIATKNMKHKYTHVNTWVGMKRKEDGNYSWISGASCNYTKTGLCKNDSHWLDGEPDDFDGKENCVALVKLIGFNDYSCDEKFMFFCMNNSYSEFTTTTTIITTEIKNADISDPSPTELTIGLMVTVTILVILVVILFIYFRKKVRNIQGVEYSQSTGITNASQMPSISPTPSRSGYSHIDRSSNVGLSEQHDNPSLNKIDDYAPENIELVCT